MFMRKISSFLAMLVLSSLFVMQGLLAQDLPVRISSGDAEYWYYAQFNRSKVFYDRDIYVTGSAIGTNLTQSAPVSGSLEQQWKFIGTTDAYQMVNKAGKVLKYNADVDKYQSADAATEEGTLLGFRVYSGNPTATANGKTFPVSGYILFDISLGKGLNEQGRATICPYGGVTGHDNIINFIEVIPLITAPDLLAFGEVLQGQSREKTIDIVGLNTAGDISATVTGQDAAAFQLDAQTLVATGGSLKVTFSPTEKRQYQANLELTSTGANPKVISLSGRSDFDLPVTISEGTDHWYYIMSARSVGSGTILTSPTELGDSVKLARYDASSEAQLWKIVGDWDNYQLINKATGLSIQYDETQKVYTSIDGDFGHLFSFEAFNGNLSVWQLKDLIVAESSATSCYLNETQSKWMTVYTKNDSGCELRFVPAGEATLLAPTSWDAGNSLVGETPKTGNIIITRISIADPFSAVVSGKDADAFSLSYGTPELGDTLKVTYTPNHLRKQTALITVTAGSVSRAITVTGTAIGAPVFTPEGASNEESYWYLIQFNRRNTLSWNWDSESTKIYQTPLGTDTMNTNRWYKFVGDAFDFKILGWDNKVARIDPALDRLILSSEGNADLMTFYQQDNDGFSIKDKNQTNKYLNDNAAVEIGVYSYYDAGDPLIITEIPGKDYPASTTVTERASLPVFSTPEAPVYYLIQFERTASKEDVKTNVWAWANEVGGSAIQQAVATDTTDTKQWWYFFGDETGFKIRAYNDAGELAYDSTLVQDPSPDAAPGDMIPRNYLVKPLGEGDTHSMERVSKWVHWSIKNLDTFGESDETYTYINDYNGDATALGLYEDQDGGNPVIFTLVPGQTIPTGLPEVTDPFDRVVAVKYYNLQGAEVVAPATTGVYIVREILASGKVRARKAIYIVR
jgi:hypothetical protein